MKRCKLNNKYRITGLNLLLWRWCNCDLDSFNTACMFEGIYTMSGALYWVKTGKLGGNLHYKKQFIKAYSNFIKDYFTENEIEY